MKIYKPLIFLLILLSSCEKEDINSLESKITLNPFSTNFLALNNKTILFPPQDFGHSKIFWIPISYYAPIIDTTQVMLRLLVPLIYDEDYGLVQATTLNIVGSDSIELDGTSLHIYNNNLSLVVSYPPNEGQSILAPYTDLTVVMVVYNDSTMNIIPNARYSNDYLNVPEKPIIGFYFLVTDYYAQ